MFCQTCGSCNNATAKFCGNCGEAFVSYKTEHHTNSNSTCANQTSSANSTCSNGKEPLSFQEHMESRKKSENHSAELESMYKRKTSERVCGSSKKKTKKDDEIVKVLVIDTKFSLYVSPFFSSQCVFLWCTICMTINAKNYINKKIVIHL